MVGAGVGGAPGVGGVGGAPGVGGVGGEGGAPGVIDSGHEFPFPVANSQVFVADRSREPKIVPRISSCEPAPNRRFRWTSPRQPDG